MSKTIPLEVQKLNPAATMPIYAYPGDAGFDLACVESFKVMPGCISIVPTGLALAIPIGYEVQIRSRSGLAAKRGIQVLNSPGTVDSNFLGELQVILYNHGYEIQRFEAGDRIAQGVLSEVPHAEFYLVDKLSKKTSRGDKGLGSSGV